MRRRLLLSPKLSLTCLPCTSASFNASSQVVRTPSSGSILQRSGLSSTEVSEPLEARGMGRLCLFEDIASLPDQALPLGHKCLSSWSTFPKWGCPCLFCRLPPDTPLRARHHKDCSRVFRGRILFKHRSLPPKVGSVPSMFVLRRSIVVFPDWLSQRMATFSNTASLTLCRNEQCIHFSYKQLWIANRGWRVGAFSRPLLSPSDGAKVHHNLSCCFSRCACAIRP